MNTKSEKILPFAIAVAEAVHDRQVRLDQLKAVRRHQQLESAETLAVATSAYKTAKRRVREAYTFYKYSRARVIAGKEPGQFDEETATRLRMSGWEI